MSGLKKHGAVSLNAVVEDSETVYMTKGGQLGKGVEGGQR